MLAINVLPPFLLTALVTRPDRLMYLSSGLHSGGDDSLRDLNWEHRTWGGAQPYSDSKLLEAALAAIGGRRGPDIRSNAWEPGWVSAKMGANPARQATWPKPICRRYG
ncbi:hypothetical protein [Streptomyces sp. enrichment culture]|uniref:hypothetical protein n=1 Tax=Streptomyces sp. enrichment culture TaxID=1795815 RepID=UPI003F57430D